MAQGLILFAHGARDPGWAEPFEALAARVRRLVPGTPVQLAFLELMQPDLRGAVAELVAQGADAIHVVPIFLGQGGHLRKDLPAQIAEVRAKHPGLTLDCTAPAGEDFAVLDAMAAFCVQRLGD